VKFLIDAQLPIALGRFVRQQGHAAIHVADIGMAADDDGPIWDRAASELEIIITKDEDFALRRILTVAGPPQIVWLRVGNCSNRALMQWLAPLWPDIVRRLAGGDALVEVV
jgi:predicted nuclease of predicted toxin-antitoxin system